MRKTKTSVVGKPVEPEPNPLESRIRAIFYESARAEDIAPLLDELRAECERAGGNLDDLRRKMLDPRSLASEARAKHTEFLQRQFEVDRLRAALTEGTSRLEMIKQAELAVASLAAHRDVTAQREKMASGFRKVTHWVRDLAEAVKSVADFDEQINRMNARNPAEYHVAPILDVAKYPNLRVALNNFTNGLVMSEADAFNLQGEALPEPRPVAETVETARIGIA